MAWEFPGKCQLTTGEVLGTLPTSGWTSSAQQPGQHWEVGAEQQACSTEGKVHTFLSLVANEACEAFGAEAVEEDIVLVQQAGPTIQALAGVTEVTCSDRNKQVLHSVDIWGGRGNDQVSAGPPRERNQVQSYKKPWEKGRQVNGSEQAPRALTEACRRGHCRCGFGQGAESFTEEGTRELV